MKRIDSTLSTLLALLFCFVFFPRDGSKAASPLDCAEFDYSCQWLNANTPSASNSTLVWYRSSTAIDPNQLQMTTGTSQTPNGSYAIASTIVVDTANTSQRAVLVSAIVPCQYQNASFIFNYWTSPFVLLNICSRTEGVMLNRTSDCQLGPLAQGPGPANISIPPMKSPFRILIEASNFVYSNGPLTGGFAVLDNVIYTGDFCTNKTANSSTTAAGNGTATVTATSSNSTGISNVSNTTSLPTGSTATSVANGTMQIANVSANNASAVNGTSAASMNTTTASSAG